MLLLLAIVLPLGMAGVLLALARLKPAFVWGWLLAVLTALLTWALLVAQSFFLPNAVTLLQWQTLFWFQQPPALLIDEISLPFAVLCASLTFAVLATAGIRNLNQVGMPDARLWAGMLAFGAVGLLAALAQNPLTLALAWMLLDAVEQVLMLTQVRAPRAREQTVVIFSARVLGTLFLLWAALMAWAEAGSLQFEAVPARAQFFLLLAAGLRLGVLPLHLPFADFVPLRRGLGTLLRLIPAVSALMLLARVASVPILLTNGYLLTAFTVIAGLYAGWGWWRAENSLAGRPFWLLGIGALAVFAALNGAPWAVVAWSVSGLVLGGLLFLLEVQPAPGRWLLAGAVLFLGLPFTPSAGGLSGGWGVLAGVTHALLWGGWLRFTLRVQSAMPPASAVLRWTYRLGTLILLSAGWVGQRANGWDVTLLWVLLPLGGAALWGWWKLRSPRALPPGMLTNLRLPNFSLGWLYSRVWQMYRVLLRAFATLNELLEGEGGVLWSFLLLALVFALVSEVLGG